MLLFQGSRACFDNSKRGREEKSEISSRISVETNPFSDLREYKWVILFFLLFRVEKINKHYAS